MLKKVTLYFIMSFLFAVILAVSYQAFMVLVVGTHDPKFGKLGTVLFAAFVASICAAVAFLSATLLFFFNSRKKNVSNEQIIFQCMLNGLFMGVLYMPLLDKLPIISGVVDWPQYVLYFLIFGVLVSVFSSYISGRINRTTNQSRSA